MVTRRVGARGFWASKDVGLKLIEDYSWVGASVKLW